MPAASVSEKPVELPVAAKADPAATTVAPMAMASVPANRSRSSGRPRMRQADHRVPATRTTYAGMLYRRAIWRTNWSSRNAFVPDGRLPASAATSTCAVRILDSAKAVPNSNTSSANEDTRRSLTNRWISPWARYGTVSTAPRSQYTRNSATDQPCRTPRNTTNEAAANMASARAHSAWYGRRRRTNCTATRIVNAAATTAASSGNTHMALGSAVSAQDLLATQRAAEHLPGGELGQRGHDLDHLGDLEPGQGLRRVISQLLLRRRRAGLQDHERLHRLPRPGVRDADHPCLEHRGMGHQDLLDLLRVHVEPRHDHEVLLPVHQVQVAVLVPHRDVAGPQPLPLEQRGLGVLVLVPVPAEHVGTANHDLPGVTLLDVLPLVVHQADLDAGQGQADGTGSGLLAQRGGGDRGGRLRQAVAVPYRDAEALPESLLDLWGQRRRAR